MQYIMTMDGPTVNQLRYHLDELRKLKEKYPDDYEQRVGYKSRVKLVLETVNYLFREVK